jgi:hypothetical protein
MNTKQLGVRGEVHFHPSGRIQHTFDLLEIIRLRLHQHSQALQLKSALDSFICASQTSRS